MLRQETSRRRGVPVALLCANPRQLASNAKILQSSLGRQLVLRFSHRQIPNKLITDRAGTPVLCETQLGTILHQILGRNRHVSEEPGQIYHGARRDARNQIAHRSSSNRFSTLSLIEVHGQYLAG